MHRRFIARTASNQLFGSSAGAAARFCSSDKAGRVDNHKLLRPVELADGAQMIRPRDAYFGYVGHSEPVAVVFPLARGEPRGPVPAVSDEVSRATMAAASSPGVVVNGELHAEPASFAVGSPRRSRNTPRRQRRRCERAAAQKEAREGRSRVEAESDE